MLEDGQRCARRGHHGGIEDTEKTIGGGIGERGKWNLGDGGMPALEEEKEH
jgi:hypothetical protein